MFRMYPKKWTTMNTVDANTYFTYPNIGSTEGQFGDNPSCKFAAIVGKPLMLFDLAVVVRLATLACHHLLLNGYHHNVKQTRYYIQQVPFCVIRLGLCRVGLLKTIEMCISLPSYKSNYLWTLPCIFKNIPFIQVYHSQLLDRAISKLRAQIHYWEAYYSITSFLCQRKNIFICLGYHEPALSKA